MWFTEAGADRIGRIATEAPHGVLEFLLPNRGSEPHGITAGPDGNLWFTESAGDRIGRIDSRPPHTIAEIPIPTRRALAQSIAAGPDGNVWFAEWGGSRIGRVTLRPVPAIEEFPLPRFPTSAAAVVGGPDGNVWWAGAGQVIGRALAVLPAAMLELPLRVKNGNPSVITAGTDGNLWFGQLGTGTIGRILPATPHTVTEFQIPGGRRAAAGLCATPGFVWLIQQGHAALTRISVSPPHRILQVPLPPELGVPAGIATGPDGHIWLTAPGHNAVARLLLDAEDRALGESAGTPATVIAQYAPAPPPPIEGELDIRTTADCTVSFAGGETFRVTREGGKVVAVPAGPHRLTAVAAFGDERIEKSVEVFPGVRAHVVFEGWGARNAGTGSGAFVPSDPGIEFVSIPAGEFLMGAETGPQDERPAHPVRLTRPFDLARFELTQAQWEAVMGPLLRYPATEDPAIAHGPRIKFGDLKPLNPVIHASWNDAQELIAKLNEIAPNHVYRLPTEAEWEYACRAGGPAGPVPELHAVAWFLENFELELHPVGKKRPNSWGLHDMHGNASEWVSDWYDRDYYRRSPASDPPGPPSGYTKVMRGCSAWSVASNCDCTDRQGEGHLPVGREFPSGIRLVRLPK